MVKARGTAVAIVVVMTVSAWGCQSEEGSPLPAEAAPAASAPTAAPAAEAAAPAMIQFTPPPPAFTGELPPLPASPYQLPRPPEVIRAVYTFAARHPEVLHYVPCFCGCEKSGHNDNDDCFIKSRDASGRPTWEPHGMT